MDLTFHYVHAEKLGYGRMGVYLHQELERLGVNVYDNDGGLQVHDWAHEEALGIVRKLVPSPTNAVCWASPPSHMRGWRQGQHTSMLTMWESMRLPEGFRANFSDIDRVIVPSEQNLELFSEFHDDVHLMPLGIDPTEWTYSPPPPRVPEFRFLISGRGARKGVDLAARAFRDVFKGVRGSGAKGAPKLIIKSARGQIEHWGQGIEHITSYLTPEQEQTLYASAHCYVQPSRGEGFGLQPLQAIASGRPTILTDAHGHAGYAHLGIPISADHSFTGVGSFMYGDAGDWWEPDYDELCEAMWDVYSHYDTHVEYAAASAEVVAKDWTWAKTAERFVEILGGEMAERYRGDGTWVKPTELLFRVVTDQDYGCDIAGASLRFQKGVEYWQTADIKRVLFDRGILDVSCLEGTDHGLQPDQAELLGVYRAEKEWCPTCAQQLNSGIQRADVIYEQMCAEAGVEA